MFDIDAVKCYYNDKEGATDRRLALILRLQKSNRQVLSVICPLSSRQVKYLKVSDKNTYISFWSVGIFMHTISLYIF